MQLILDAHRITVREVQAAVREPDPGAAVVPAGPDGPV
jgi:hypothetical protein